MQYCVFKSLCAVLKAPAIQHIYHGYFIYSIKCHLLHPQTAGSSLRPKVQLRQITMAPVLMQNESDEPQRITEVIIIHPERDVSVCLLR